MMDRGRVARHLAVARAIADVDDRDLAARLEAATGKEYGIGGTGAAIAIAGTRVFVKRVPLTDRERDAGPVGSTTNQFDLPPCYQYGVGSTGFGAGRELAAHRLTTKWMLAGRADCFPLLHHWRVVEGAPPPPSTPETRAEIERAVEYWNGSPAVRDRLEALARASAAVVLVLEHVPQTLDAWLTQEADAGRLESAAAMAEHQLRTGTALMNQLGLFHFDAHFANVLTDGTQLLFGDLGLATSPAFALSPREIEFLDANRSHDTAYAVTQLVNWLVTRLIGAPVGPRERNAFIRDHAESSEPGDLPAWADAIVTRLAPVAALTNSFYWSLRTESRATSYPSTEIERAIATIAPISLPPVAEFGDHRPRLGYKAW